MCSLSSKLRDSTNARRGETRIGIASLDRPKSAAPAREARGGVATAAWPVEPATDAVFATTAHLSNDLAKPSPRGRFDDIALPKAIASPCSRIGAAPQWGLNGANRACRAVIVGCDQA